MSVARTNRVRDAKERGVPSALGRWLSIDDVIATVGLSRTHIYREMEAGRFPRQHKLTTWRVAWWSPEVDAWNRERLQPANTP